MARTLPTPKYTYSDAYGNTYCTTTETYDKDEGTIQTGESLKYVIEDGGDHTTCTKSVGSIAALGTGR